MPRNSLLAACALALLVPVSAADDGARKVTAYDGHVQFEIPAEWNEIPFETLEFYSLRSADASGGRIAEVYQLGYRPGDPELDFALPQILLQIRESGREPYGQFLHLPPTDVLREMTAERLVGRIGPLLDGLELEEASFDRSRFALHLTNALDLRLEGNALVISVSFLTERGFFTLHCYTHADQAEETGPIFARIIDSIEFDDELAYRPRLADRWPPRPSTIAFTAAGVTALAIVVMVLVERRRKT